MSRKQQMLAVALYIILVQYVTAFSRIDPLVDTNLGLIRGLKSSDGDFSMFMGIPYATVDDANPFGPSKPHPGFDDVFEAYDDSAICPQVEEFNNTIVGTLDCLHLNVYVPNKASTKNPLPVLVWIYGGGFSIGFAGRYVHGPSYLVKHDVILVTLNYRLGPYGFMCLDNPKVPGNQGLKDQSLALKWVKDNIAAFGGNHNKITLMGESAGGVSVDLHLLYQQERLFDKVIMQSGSAILPWVVEQPEISAPIALAEYLGFETPDENAALTFLSTSETNLVIAASQQLGLTLRVCVEKEFDGVEAFITKHPLNTALQGANNIPMLIGYNNHERLGEYANKETLMDTDTFREFIASNLDLEEDKLDEMVELVRHFYVGDEVLSDETVWDVIDFKSDFEFNTGVTRTIEKYIKSGVENIYHYIFSYNGTRNFVKSRLSLLEGGASHADEISYLFDVAFMRDEPTPEDQAVIDSVTTLWTNFVKYGNPTPETTDLLPVAWDPVSKDMMNYLSIDADLSLKQRPFYGRMSFWQMFYKLNEKAQKGYQTDDESN